MQDKPDRQELEKVIGILAEQKISWPDIRKGIEELAEPIPRAPDLQNYDRMYVFFTRYCLTSSEIKVFILAVKGFSNDEIAEHLFVSKNTVRFHLKNIYHKTAISGRIALIKLGIGLGL